MLSPLLCCAFRFFSTARENSRKKEFLEPDTAPDPRIHSLVLETETSLSASPPGGLGVLLLRCVFVPSALEGV